METSPLRNDARNKPSRLFECPVDEQTERRLSKAEALEYVRVIRAQLHRRVTEPPIRRVA